jgi:hypothetical protein
MPPFHSLSSLFRNTVGFGIAGKSEKRWKAGMLPKGKKLTGRSKDVQITIRILTTGVA